MENKKLHEVKSAYNFKQLSIDIDVGAVHVCGSVLK